MTSVSALDRVRQSRFDASPLSLRVRDVSAIVTYAMLALAPPFLMVVLSASSYALGMLMGSTVAVLLLLRYLPGLRVEVRVLLAYCALGAWGFAPLIADQTVPLSRIVLSAVAVTWLGFVALLLRDAFSELDHLAVRRLLVIPGTALLAIAWAAALFGYAPFGYAAGLAQPVFPFREPSHFALVAGPLLGALAALSGTRTRFFVVLNLGGLGVVFPSFSIALFAAAVAVLVLRIPHLVILAGVGAVMVVLIATIDFGYFSARLQVGPGATNMSTLMWLQGYEDAADAFRRSNGLGVGFQALGYASPGSIARRIMELFDFRMSREAGGFMAAKLIGEYGYAGIIVVVLILRSAIRSARHVRRIALRRIPDGSSDVKELVAHSYVALFWVELTARSIGYFSPSFLFFIAALLYVHHAARRAQARTARAAVASTS